MALPEPDETVASGAKPRRGVSWWAKHVLIVFVVIVIAVALGIPAYQGYRPRALINGALMAGNELKIGVAEFYEQHDRLPQPAEAAALQLRPSVLKQARSVVWDSAGRSVIITVDEPQSQAGKRVALYAEERDRTLFWTCRTIDLEVKYLPATCR